MAVTNTLQDYGWEYVWHCHLLGHEENDMMRPMVFEVAPAAPSALVATPGTGSVALAWTDNATEPAATMYTVERATDSGFTAGVVDIAVNNATAVAHTDTVAAGTYFYRVRAENAAAYSPWSNIVSATAL